jgi:hypothetical protein
LERLVLIDVNYPASGNRLGPWAAELWKRAGDVIRDLPPCSPNSGLQAADKAIRR